MYKAVGAFREDQPIYPGEYVSTTRGHRGNGDDDDNDRDVTDDRDDDENADTILNSSCK